MNTDMLRHFEDCGVERRVDGPGGDAIQDLHHFATLKSDLDAQQISDASLELWAARDPEQAHNLNDTSGGSGYRRLSASSSKLRGVTR